MNYTDYFANAVAAELDQSIFVTTCDKRNQIIDSRAMTAQELDEALTIADYYKVEMSGNKATIYVNQ